MSLEIFQVLVLALFVASAAPAVVENIRHGSLSNRNNAILFIAGLATYGVGLALGHYQFDSVSLVWAVGIALVLLASAFSGLVPGGLAKTLVALLPWLSIDAFLVAVAVGMLLTAALAKVKGGTAPAMPAMALAVTGALIAPLLSL